MNEKVLLIYTAYYKIQNPLNGVAPPYGLAWIAQSLKEKNIICEICDLSLIKNKNELYSKLTNSVKHFNPDAIGVSIRNITTGVEPAKSFLPYLKIIIQHIRSITNIPLIAGGAGFSLYPQDCMEQLDIDYGIIGEGEKAFPQLLETIFLKKNPDAIPNVVYKKNSRIIINKYESISEKDFVVPDHSLIDYDAYDRIGGYFPIQTKRGCQFACIYCTYPYLERKTYRFRSPKDIVKEISHLKNNFSMEHFFFTDSVFSYPRDYCISVLQEIIKHKINISWSAYINPKDVTEELIKLFKASGCSSVEVTIDTASLQTLKAYNKNFSLQEMYLLDTYLYKYEIPALYWVNLGGPGETRLTLQENLKNLSQLKSVSKGWVGKGFIVLPGSPLYEIALKENKIKKASLNDFYQYVSDDLPPDFAEEIQKFCFQNPMWYSRFDRIYPGYMEMVSNIMNNKIRNHYLLQHEYGLKRLELYKQNKIKIYSQKEFDSQLKELHQGEA